MNVLTDIARYLEKRTGLKAEVEPSMANIKRSEGVLLVSVNSFWQTPSFNTHDIGYRPTMEHSFEQDGPRVEGAISILPIKITYHAEGRGKMWVSTVLNNTHDLALSLCNENHIPFVGNKLSGNAYDRVKAVIPDFDKHNLIDPNSNIGFVMVLDRAMADDKGFIRQRINDKNAAFLAEQVFKGHLILYTGMEVPQNG